MKAYFLLPILALSTYFAQSQNNVVDTGCIAIKQTFYGIGEGKYEPILKKSVVTLNGKKGNEKNEVVLTLTKDECLNTNIVAVVRRNESDDYVLYNGDVEVTDAINVKSTIDNMANDDNQTFEFKIESLIPGTKTTITKSASDPYRNWFNFGKRNSYTLNTTLIYDIPVSIQVLNADKKDNLNIDEHDCLELQFGDFIADGDAILKYRVNGVNTEWQRCDRVQVTPQGTVVLSYEDLFVNEMSNVAKAIQFVAEKKMMNGVISQGNIVECTFYRNAPTFEIEKVINTTCGLKVGIKVDKGLDLFNEIIKDVNNYYWELSNDLNCTSLDGKNFNNNVYSYTTNVVPIVDSENDNSFIVDLTECINKLEPTSNIDTNGNKNGYKGVFKLCFSLVNNPKYQDLNIVPIFFKVDKTIEKVTIDQIGPKDNQGVTEQFYSSTSYSDKKDQYAVLNFTDNHYRFDYIITKDGDDGWGEKKVSLNSYLADIQLDYEVLDSFINAFPLDLYPKGKTYDNEIGNRWKDFYTSKYDEWFKNYCKPIPITNFSQMSRKKEWGDDDISDAFSLLMIYDEEKSTSYFIWTPMYQINVGVFAIEGVTKDFVDSWYANYKSTHYVIDRENNRLYYNEDISSITPLLKSMEASLSNYGVDVNMMMSSLVDGEVTDAEKKDVFVGFNNIPVYKFIDYSGCKVMVYDGDKACELHVCGRGGDYHNTTVIHGNWWTGFKCGIYDTEGYAVYYNGDVIVTGMNSINAVPEYEVKSIKYASSSWVQYEYKDGKKYKQYIGKSANPAGNIAQGWLNEFYELEYAKYLSNVGYKLYNVEYNKKQTYTLTDSYGCPSEFDVVVYSAEFEEISSTAPTKWNSADGSLELKYTKGPKIKYGDTEYSPGDNTKIDFDNCLPASGSLSFSIVGASGSIQYKYNIGHGIDAVYASYCESLEYGRIKVIVDDNKTNKEFILKNGDDQIEIKETTEGSIVFDNVNKGTYEVYVKSGDVSVKWPKEFNITDSVFEINTFEANDATDIGGKGSVTIDLKNIVGKTVMWSFDGGESSSVKPTLSELAPGFHSISAELDDYCTIDKEFEIKEPVITASVTIEECDEKFSVKVGEDKNIVNGDLNLYCETEKVDNWNGIAISEEEKTYTLKFCPKDGTPWDIVTFSLSKGQHLNNLTTKHTLNQEHYCPEKPMNVSILPKTESNANDLFLVYNKNEYGKDIPVEVNSGIGQTISYQVIGRKNDDDKINGKCKIQLTYEFKKSYQEKLNFIAPFSGDYVIDDFTCNESSTTDLIINKLEGGASDAKLLYSFDDKNWFALASDHKITITNPHENEDKADPITYEYQLYLKDNEHSCESQQFLDVHKATCPAKLSVDITNVVQPICEGTNSGAISVKASGGTLSSYGGYCYFIDPENDGTEKGKISNEVGYSNNYTANGVAKQFENLFAGNHRVIVFDNNQCMASTEVELKEYQNPYVSAATFDSVSCYGLSDGAVMVDSIHGTAPVNIYRLYESSGKEIDPITLTKKELENAASLYIADKAATIRDSIWTHESGDAIVKFENLPSANYYLCLTDTNNCATIVTPADEDRRFSIKVLQPDSLILFIDLEDTIIANYGMPGGEVNVHAEGGNKGRFLVSVDDTVYNTTNQNLSVTLKDIFLPGRHCIKAEDSKQCADTAYTGIMRQPDSRLRLTAQTVDALCKNKTGAITVAASGGWGVYQYSCPTVGANLGHGDLEYTFTGLYGGVYKVSVTDSARAVFDTTIIVNTPPELLAMPVPQDATCRDDGRIAVNLSGGVMPYRVFADFADTIYIDDTTYTSVAAFPGYYPSSEYAYEVYVMDSNDCTALAPVVITDSIPKASVKFANPSFHNVSNGNLTANVSKGTSPYSYLWTNRNTGATFTGGPSWKNISAGTYSLVVTDAHDCYANSGNQCDLCWFEYVPTAGDRELTIDTICNETGVGAQDGFVRIVSDTAGFSEVILYSCSSQSDMTEQASDKRQFELSGLSCGPYVLECRLPKGEVRYASFVIQEYKPLWLFVNNMRHVTTSGSENGRATVSIVDGASPYQAVIIKDSELYLDTIFESSKLNLDSLGAATYHVTVIDWYGKKRSIDFVINAPQAPLRLITDSVENVSCFSYDNGVVHLRAEGGWGDYQFAPVGGQYGNSTTFGNRVAGSYSFVAIDRLGVTDTLNVDVDQPERLSVGEPMVDSVTCFGDFDGSVKFNISGGNGGYVTYSDHGFSVHGDYVDNLNSDTYKFYFSDKKRCPSLDTLVVYVPQPDSLSIGETVRNTTCGESNGSIRINVTGGVKPYTYLWNDTTISKSDDQSVVYGLRQLGLYEVKVVDRNGCGVGKSFRIGASTKPRIARVSTLPIKCTGDSNGTAMLDSADLIPATPYAPFRIIWPNGQNQMAVNDLPAGRFSVTIADTNGCSSDFGFEIKSQSPLELQKLGSRDAHCYNYTDGAISVVAFGGAGNYSFLWNTGDTLSQISNIGMGSYTVVVTDANECRDTATYSISQPDSLYVDLGYDIYMCPENTYEFDPGAYATYEWKRNDTVLSTERVLTADGQGLYCIEVTDDAGCFSHDSVYVAVGIDLLKADFVMASDAPIDDTIALIELSNMEIDSLRWEFDNGVFETIDYSDYEIYLKPDTLGMHAITLWAYSGGCVSYQTKQIEIVEQADTTATANYGYNPLIKSILLKPNPNDGQFTVDIELREAHDIGATISNVGTGAQVAGFSRSGDSKYSENVDISNSGSGVYVLRVVAGDETRSVRFMITR